MFSIVRAMKTKFVARNWALVRISSWFTGKYFGNVFGEFSVELATICGELCNFIRTVCLIYEYETTNVRNSGLVHVIFSA